jgi:hypothetical protein
MYCLGADPIQIRGQHMPFHQTLNQAPSSPSRDDGSVPKPPLTTSTSARGPPHDFPHLTTQELAARWRCTVFTLSNNYQKWGLRPARIGKRLLFPIDQVEAVEERSMGKPKQNSAESAA